MYESLPRALRTRYDALKQQNAARDSRHAQIAEGRAGNIQKVLPGVFPDTWPRPIVANVLDDSAKELANVLAMLPGIDCLPNKAGSESAKRSAAKRTRIALGYIENSRLRKQLQVGADWYFTYGALPFIIEPSTSYSRPCIRLDNPRGAYWITDAYGEVEVYCKEWTEPVMSLCAKFPELASHIKAKTQTTNWYGRVKYDEATPDEQLKVVRLYDKTGIYMWLPERDDCILATSKNYLDRVPVEIAELAKFDNEARGAFDQVLWVWLAHNRMALLGMEAAKKAIQAPIVAGDDVQRIPVGPDAVLRTREPEKVKRLSLDMPQSHFLETSMLQNELQQGISRMPSMANFDASIVTGQGVNALAGAFNNTIKSGQDNVGEAMRRALQLCFQLDEKLWPGLKKKAMGVSNGAPFEEEYQPSKDIKGNYSVSVTYGFIAGLDPSRGLVYLLQLRGDRAIDRATMLRALPQEIDVDALSRDIDLERIDDAALAGIEGLGANLPMLAQSGQVDIQAGLRALSIVRKERMKGTPVAEALEKALTPPEPAPAPAVPEVMPGSPEEAAAAGGGGPMPEQIAAGEGMNSMQQLLAGLSGGGNPDLRAGVLRQIPT